MSKVARSPAEHFRLVTLSIVSVAPTEPMTRARWSPIRTVRFLFLRHRDHSAQKEVSRGG